MSRKRPQGTIPIRQVRHSKTCIQLLVLLQIAITMQYGLPLIQNRHYQLHYVKFKIGKRGGVSPSVSCKSEIFFKEKNPAVTQARLASVAAVLCAWFPERKAPILRRTTYMSTATESKVRWDCPVSYFNLSV